MRYSLILLLFTLADSSQAQHKYDYTWLLGAGNISGPNAISGGMILDFNQNPPLLTQHPLPVSNAFAMINDKNGNLVAYTDGCRVLNKKDEIMVDGQPLSPGDLYNEFCTDNGSFPSYQGQLFLPFPDSNNKYILFHIASNSPLWTKNLLDYSILDASLDNGNGIVISKNNIIVQDTFADYITATRHANGRDWWVIAPKRWKNTYHTCLVTPDGVKGPWSQIIGDNTPGINCCGQAIFSPDGSKYIKAIPKNGIQILDFDRCSGQFTNPIYISTLTDSIGASGAAVSPNSRFLYIPTSLKVWQYDLESSDVAASRKTVAVYDGFTAPFATTFYQAMTTPEGKIFISCTNSNKYMHIIHNPNEEGIACNIEQHGFQMPTVQWISIPNFINYRLWDIPGSPCDTLGIDVPPVVSVSVPTNEPFSLLISPNPSTGSFDLTLPSNFTSGKIRIFNSTGILVLEKSVYLIQKSISLDFSNQSMGMYFIALSNENGEIVSSNKVIIQH
jgi:hypothetical protein